ncbi:hypothetical protein FGO68_gene4592 [Halteria grandinella]|uniref:Uncharacterized protein n=1 Tax=Halteria grandinella TaxID=5974 RepID=A0A8J8P4W9_HALGN|nr:hypothetical protein FGO68_gene4592 [Halteria grandinella]
MDKINENKMVRKKSSALLIYDIEHFPPELANRNSAVLNEDLIKITHDYQEFSPSRMLSQQNMVPQSVNFEVLEIQPNAAPLSKPASRRDKSTPRIRINKGGHSNRNLVDKTTMINDDGQTTVMAVGGEMSHSKPSISHQIHIDMSSMLVNQKGLFLEENLQGVTSGQISYNIQNSSQMEMTPANQSALDEYILGNKLMRPSEQQQQLNSVKSSLSAQGEIRESQTAQGSPRKAARLLKSQKRCGTSQGGSHIRHGSLNMAPNNFLVQQYLQVYRGKSVLAQETSAQTKQRQQAKMRRQEEPQKGGDFSSLALVPANPVVRFEKEKKNLVPTIVQGTAFKTQSSPIKLEQKIIKVSRKLRRRILTHLYQEDHQLPQTAILQSLEKKTVHRIKRGSQEILNTQNGSVGIAKTPDVANYSTQTPLQLVNRQNVRSVERFRIKGQLQQQNQVVNEVIQQKETQVVFSRQLSNPQAQSPIDASPLIKNASTKEMAPLQNSITPNMPQINGRELQNQGKRRQYFGVQKVPETVKVTARDFNGWMRLSMRMEQNPSDLLPPQQIVDKTSIAQKLAKRIGEARFEDHKAPEIIQRVIQEGKKISFQRQVSTQLPISKSTSFREQTKPDESNFQRPAVVQAISTSKNETIINITNQPTLTHSHQEEDTRKKFDRLMNFDLHPSFREAQSRMEQLSKRIKRLNSHQLDMQTPKEHHVIGGGILNYHSSIPSCIESSPNKVNLALNQWRKEYSQYATKGSAKKVKFNEELVSFKEPEDGTERGRSPIRVSNIL